MARQAHTINFPFELHAAVRQAAQERGLSFNRLVVAAVEDFLPRLPPLPALDPD